MAALKPLVAAGHGKIAAILPDTTSSTRYVEFDAPDIKKAAEAAGMASSDITVENALGSDSTFVTDAESAITNGATVLLIDPEDSGTGLTVTRYAKAHGVAVIDYDRLTLGSPPGTKYVSFNNVRVGQLIGRASSAASRRGTSRAERRRDARRCHGQQRDAVRAGLLQRAEPAVFVREVQARHEDRGTWKPPQALTEFEGAFTAHSNINSAVIPNDETGAPIISYLQSHGVKAKTFPTTGQDATLVGLQNVLAGYQCGTVYKPIYLEAQSAIAVAMYLRAGKAAPSGLLNGTTTDTVTHAAVPSSLLTPIWVTPANMNDTIVKDQFVPTAQLCAGKYAADCKAAGITS